MLPLGFGVSFQLPLVMLFLQRIGIMSIELYLNKWRIAVLVMACLAAVLSPGGDPYSMLFMFVPLVCLFFLGIALCKYMPRNADKDEEMIKSME
jgi:sec-independent protein translocase protein TatC